MDGQEKQELQGLFDLLREDRIKAKYKRSCRGVTDFSNRWEKLGKSWDFMSYRAGYIEAVYAILYDSHNWLKEDDLDERRCKYCDEADQRGVEPAIKVTVR